ncbi:uridine-cytidine kinase [Candidatus Mycoplasma mahonii]|uniref:uridine-cytidine kinase n=1 Tax=Candidatus Mycoplasma mahonii TaxID=3004105 RepID=UPI0026EE8D78|nr:uridine-cytidine kinase [Candidatus Mycoplasma mahonii]WKX02458.1 uridine-cytidine kinase [Candidatus Mycoplasma mahonii]
MSKLILITGGSASGKSTVAKAIKKEFGNDALLVSQDNFYLPVGSPKTNYDTPKAFDMNLQKQIIKDLLSGNDVQMPIYCFSKHARDGYETINSKGVIIFEGLFTFKDLELMELATLKIFVDTPSDTRLGRRVMRDVNKRQRKISDIINRWEKDVKPAYHKHISQAKTQADIIVPWTAVNMKSLNALFNSIRHN